MALGGKGPVTVAVIWAEAAVAGLCIGLRLYVRQFIKGNVGPDDYCLLLTWLFQLLFAAFFTVSSMYGFGQHVADLQVADIMMATKIELIGQFSVSIAMGLSKTAVALFLMRIIHVKWHKGILWFWIITMLALSWLLAIACFAQCTPVESLWDPKVKATACPLNLTMIAYVMCSWSAAMDFFLALFPWYLLWDLQMKKKEKITICISLSLGIFAGVCGVIRTSGLGVLSETKDYLFATADSVMWTSSELCVTIICVSIPSLRPLYTRLTGGSSSGGYQQASDDKENSGFGISGLKTVGSKSTRQQKHRKGSDEEYGMGTITPGSGGGGKGGGTSSATVVTQTAVGSAYPYPEDSNSDKSILGNESRANAFGIKRTQEYSVTYDNNRGVAV